MTVTTARSAEISARHPLASLTVEEAGTAARLALAATGDGARLVYVTLAEPDKAAVLGWDGTPLPRAALVVTYAKPARMTWMITVSLDTATVTGKVPLPGAQPPIMIDEWMANSAGIKADPAFQAALARRGITDMSKVQIDPWPASNFGLDVDKTGRRLARGVAYLLDGPGCNPYARPIENMVAIWDRDTGEMVELQDGEVVPVPAAPGRYDAASFPAPRTLAPLDILQPQGPGFTVDDGCLRWGPW
jgi:primary-amine oxidase